jgi:hypothetical protein
MEHFILQFVGDIRACSSAPGRGGAGIACTAACAVLAPLQCVPVAACLYRACSLLQLHNASIKMLPCMMKCSTDHGCHPMALDSTSARLWLEVKIESVTGSSGGVQRLQGPCAQALLTHAESCLQLPLMGGNTVL